MIREILPSIYLVRPSGKAAEIAFTYVLRRPSGSIIFATKVDMAPFSKEIQALGSVEHVLLGDRHHALPNTATIAERWGTGLTCSKIEAVVLQKQGVTVAHALPYERHFLAPDLEAIPTPGHTGGAFSYLWTHETTRYLFVGDTLVPVEADWKYWVTRPNRSRMMSTLQLLATVDFDVILSNSFAATPRAWIEADAHYRRSMFKKLATDLAAAG